MQGWGGGCVCFVWRSEWVFHIMQKRLSAKPVLVVIRFRALNLELTTKDQNSSFVERSGQWSKRY